MKKKYESVSERVAHALIVLFLLLFAACIVLPFLNIIAVSFSGKQAVISGEVTVWPVDFNWASYGKVVTNDYFFRAYGNTLFVVVVGTVLSMVLTLMAAFIISRSDLPGRKVITFLITLTMWFSGGMIPLFLVIRKIGLYDSLFALILPSAISAYNVIVLRSFFDTLPPSLEESAQLDGANDMIVLFRILVPLSLPSIATVTLWVAVAYWNAYTPALLYLSTRSKFTLQLVLRDIVFTNTMAQYMSDTTEVVSESLIYANIILTMLPIMMLYPFLQKYFVKGVMIGAVKG